MGIGQPPTLAREAAQQPIRMGERPDQFGRPGDLRRQRAGMKGTIAFERLYPTPCRDACRGGFHGRKQAGSLFHQALFVKTSGYLVSIAYTVKVKFRSLEARLWNEWNESPRQAGRHMQQLTRTFRPTKPRPGSCRRIRDRCVPEVRGTQINGQPFDALRLLMVFSPALSLSNGLMASGRGKRFRSRLFSRRPVANANIHDLNATPTGVCDCQ